MSSAPLTDLTPLDYFVGLIGLASFGHGYLALADPVKLSKGFNMTIVSPEGHQVAKDLFALYAARDFALGFGMASAAAYGHKQIMGFSMVGLGIMTTIDGFVSKRNREGGQWKHWIFTILPVVLAAGCFGVY